MICQQFTAKHFSMTSSLQLYRQLIHCPLGLCQALQLLPNCHSNLQAFGMTGATKLCGKKGEFPAAPCGLKRSSEVAQLPPTPPPRGPTLVQSISSHTLMPTPLKAVKRRSPMDLSTVFGGGMIG
jgi:hypothetical protein